MHPEVSFKEKNTAAFMAKYLAQFGFEVTRGIGGHGVVGVLKNGPEANLFKEELK